MNKDQLTSQIANRTGSSLKDAAEFIDAFTDTVTEALSANDNVQLVGFGNFSVNQRKATTGRNPRTGEAIQIPAKNVPKFSAGKKLKDAVN